VLAVAMTPVFAQATAQQNVDRDKTSPGDEVSLLKQQLAAQQEARTAAGNHA